MIRPEQFMDDLRSAALAKACAKDFRAATLVIQDGNRFYTASNGPPAGFICSRDSACQKTCGKSAVHAEMRALMMAGPAERIGAEMIHARFDAEGQLLASRPPRCAACTKHMLDASVAALWLWHGQQPNQANHGWTRYPMMDAHQFSCLAREIHLSQAVDVDSECSHIARNGQHEWYLTRDRLFCRACGAVAKSGQGPAVPTGGRS